MIYFAYFKEFNAIKIGHSNWPQKRIYSFLLPVDPVWLKSIKGNKEKEKDIQKDLQNYKIRGEWYSYNEFTKSYIDNLIEPEFLELFECSTRKECLRALVEYQTDLTFYQFARQLGWSKDEAYNIFISPSFQLTKDIVEKIMTAIGYEINDFYKMGSNRWQ